MNNLALIKTSPESTAIQSMADLQNLGQIFVKSGFFADIKDAAQAIVKVMAGSELGFPPIASMTGVYLFQGKIGLMANLMAAAIKKSNKYDFRVRQLTNDACKIEFFEGGESVGFADFTKKDAEAAGLSNKDVWKKFPRNMLYARAMSNGARWYCPDIFGGPVYTPEELGATIDGETGDVIEMPAPQIVEPEIIEEPKPANGNGKKKADDLCTEFWKRGRAAGIKDNDLQADVARVQAGAITWTEAIEALPEV